MKKEQTRLYIIHNGECVYFEDNLSGFIQIQAYCETHSIKATKIYNEEIKEDK